MSYSTWHREAVKKVKAVSENQLYIRVFLFSLFVVAGIYFYLTSQGARNPLNKAVADTSIILIGLSMLLSSLCYFWNFVDTKIIYRKHLGLVGFGYGIFHVVLSFSSVQTLFKMETWRQGTYWPLLAGAIAFGIFAMMAMISNKYAAFKLGGIGWRSMLRIGYIAVALIWLHVFLLKSARIITWYTEGMKTSPSTGLLVLVFMAVVILMRILLWISLARKEVNKI